MFFTFCSTFCFVKIYSLQGVPDVSLENYKEIEDGGLCFTMTIKSIPVPNYVQWKEKRNNSNTYELLNLNDAEFKGTSNSFPHPLLVLRHKETLNNYSFKIEVQNLIGTNAGNNEIFVKIYIVMLR